LNKQDIEDDDYKHALKVWKSLKIKTMGEYHDMYLATDVLILCDAFEAFRETVIEHFQLDPCHYVSLPGLGYDIALKKTQVKLDVISDYDMYLMIECSGIRGGVSMIGHRHSKANNKYMKDYNPKEESKYITYLDANALYAWSMTQHLPTTNYRWEKPEKFDATSIMMLGDKDDKGYIFEVDLDYPTSLHDLHNDYPMAPESMKIQTSMLSDRAKEILETIEIEHNDQAKKLTPNLNDKKKYVTHYRNLKFYLDQGMILKKIHRVVSFNQSAWLKPFIDFNTKQRSIAQYDYQKLFWKTLSNCVFGKFIENVRKHIRFEMVNDETRFQKLVNDPCFDNTVCLNESLCGVTRKRAEVVLDKPICIGMAITDMSKLLMYEFHYGIMKKKYGDKCKLLMTDTDSLMYEIKTDDVYADMQKDKQLYDFSDYAEDHVLHSNENKKVCGKFKDEANGKIITEFVGLRSKMYSFITDDKETKKANGIKKATVKNELKFSDYKRSLFSDVKTDIQQKISFNTIRSYKHDVYSISQNKIGLCSFDDKRHICDDNVSTLSYGHYKIKK
jgi:hypothetical protein